MTSIPTSPVRRSPELFVILVLLLGLAVATIQGLHSVSGVLGLSAVESAFPDMRSSVTSDDYVRMAVWSLPNLGLCLLALAATFVAVRSRLRGGPRLPWVGVFVILVVAALTALGLPSWPGGEV